MDDVITITIEIYKDDKVVYIAEENSSGSNLITKIKMTL